jgi:hypothetical protein
VADDTAFETFVRGNSTGLLRTAFLVTGSQHSAEELGRIECIAIARHFGH